ncbi:MAG: alpha/beta hydrolase family protein [Acidimicrobiia bacterium]
MADRDVEVTFERFTWRILSQFVSPWELDRLRAEIQTWDQWFDAWARAAGRHVEIADKAAEEGHVLTAGEAYIRAGLFYHWATFLYGHDPERFNAGMREMNRCWERAALLVDPPMELFTVPFENLHLPGYLIKPPGVQNPPLVLLVPGGDSTKEELYDFARHIVARGMAAAAFDGPGQGLVSSEAPIRPDFEVPIRAVVDHLLARDDLDGGRLAVGGISYGGLFACRAAAFDERVQAVVSVSSWYSPAGRFPGIDRVSQIALRQYMGEDPESVMNSITMAGAAGRITVPLLQVYGGLDKASPPDQAYRVEVEVPGPTTTLVFDDGVHVCNNLHHIVRPLIGDWLADRLLTR